MTPAHVPTVAFTGSSLVLVGLILLVLRLLMAPSIANLCISGFVALVIPSPLMLVAHSNVALLMVGLGLACAVPAYLLAEEHDDDGRGGDGRDHDPLDPGPGPDSGPDPELWDEFERDFWAHVDRSRELVNA
jgi:hypothetical protein